MKITNSPERNFGAVFLLEFMALSCKSNLTLLRIFLNLKFWIRARFR